MQLLAFKERLVYDQLILPGDINSADGGKSIVPQSAIDVKYETR
jgi:hypothetical protein